ncbi:Leucine Rich repeats (2 copies) [Phytophthora infestans]|uniref:Leucine Rich repeats (2 copies) n=1 Tax=Phytophthora infestans TaxID=4787 RepID=A0A833T4H3_PHYIN|nr:Leucine Rich repeats (2 copies) [Phytophthora infestans]
MSGEEAVGRSGAPSALEQRYAASLAHSNGLTLDLSSLQLTEMPPLEELSDRFPRLRQLNIRRNFLRLLPDGLARAFSQLESLNASENALEELSAASIGALRNLQRLNVAHNRLRELPISAFERLEALEELDARGNLIEKINFDNDKLPVGDGLYKLQVLLLADNRLQSIDPTTTDVLPKLRVIDLSGNPELLDAPEKLRRLHERNLLLHSRAKRRELIARALSIRKAVAQALATAPTASPKRTKFI